MKPIEGYPEYTIDANGVIRMIATNQVLAPVPDEEGRLFVRLHNEGKAARHFVFDLLAAAFPKTEHPEEAFEVPLPGDDYDPPKKKDGGK